MSGQPSRRHSLMRPLLLLGAAAAVTLAACGSDEAKAPVTAPPSEQVGAVRETTTTEVPTSPTLGEPADPADCPPVDGAAEQTRTFDGPPPNCLQEGVTYTAVVTTNKGEFSFELDTESGPVAANNFVFLARHQYFDGTECHRIIPDFVIQCGDPTATGTGGPGYTIVDEPAPKPYELGAVAMAKTAAPDSAGSQFFVITGASGMALPNDYALFGQVIDGFDTTVAAMAAAGTPGAGTPSETITIETVRIVES